MTSTVIPGKYTTDKLFLKLDTTEFNSHKSDINANGQIAFVDNGNSSYIYAQGVKVGGTDIENLNLTNYATKNYVTNAIDDLDVSDAAITNQYVSAVSESAGKIKVTRATLPAAPTLSSLGGITPGAVDTKISNAIGNLDASYTASPGKYISSISQVDGKITNVTHADLPKTVSVHSSQNVITVNGIKYTLGISSNGVLSISEDIPVTFSSFSVSPTTLATSGSNIDRGTDYVGKSYTGGTIQKTVNDTNITLTASVNNPQGKSFNYEFKDESGKVIHSGTSTNNTVSCTVKQTEYFSNGSSRTIANGIYTWGNTTVSTSTIVGSSETFSCKINSTTKTAKVTGGQSCSFTAKGKVLIAYATSSNTNLTTKDITSNEYTTIKTIKVNAGITCTIYVPTCLKISPVITIAGVNVIPTSFKKETKSLTINGCTTNYDVYTKLAGPEGGEGYEYSISFS